jgi:hypothetical protein
MGCLCLASDAIWPEECSCNIPEDRQQGIQGVLEQIHEIVS